MRSDLSHKGKGDNVRVPRAARLLKLVDWRQMLYSLN
jgi:hypothetical protein